MKKHKFKCTKCGGISKGTKSKSKCDKCGCKIDSNKCECCK